MDKFSRIDIEREGRIRVMNEPIETGEIPRPALRERMKTAAERWGRTLAALAAAAAVWLPIAHWFFTPRLDDYYRAEGIAPRAREMAKYQLSLWEDPGLRAEAIARMRNSNAEWDFMGRTFLVLSLANMALREPAMRPQSLGVIDTIIDETLRLERENGIFFFLMDYARVSAFVQQPPRSLFEDGEIALMLGARCLVEEKPEYMEELARRVEMIRAGMEAGPLLCAESYPDECWMFCNAAALVALKMSDALSGGDHGPFFERWLATAKERLTERQTGLLVSSFTLDGRVLDGPEGSSIWFVAHCLALIDEPFARAQYEKSREELAGGLLGFGYAREWPASYQGPPDIDSGPIIPWLEASAGSSGQTFMAAAQFGDDAWLKELLAALELAGFPVTRDGGRRYCASNQVGDAVLLYSMVQGPLWETIKARCQ
jgi:hypothetical protein